MIHDPIQDAVYSILGTQLSICSCNINESKSFKDIGLEPRLYASVIAAINKNLGINLTIDDIQKAKNIKNFYTLIKEKI